MTAERTSFAAKALAATMAVCAGLLLWVSWRAFPVPWSPQVLLLLAASFVSDYGSIRTSSGELTLGFPLSVAAGVFGGPASAGLVAVGSALSIRVLRERRVPTYYVMNSAQLIFVGCLFGWLYIGLGGTPMAPQGQTIQPLSLEDLTLALAPVLVAGLIASVVNLALVSVGARALFGVPFRTSGGNMLPMLLSETGLACLGLLGAELLAGTAANPFLLLVYLIPGLAMWDLARRAAKLNAAVAAAEERERVARDAHDRVYNRLAALATKLESQAASPDGALHQAAAEIRQTVVDLQTIIRPERVLKAADEEVEGADALVSVIRDSCESQAARYGFSVELVGLSCLAGLGGDIGWDIECLVEEALTNAGKHGHASHVRVLFERDARQLTISVFDNGDGVSVPVDVAALATDSTGLRGMAKRVEKWSGTVALGPGEGGAVLTVALIV